MTESQAAQVNSQILVDRDLLIELVKSASNETVIAAREYSIFPDADALKFLADVHLLAGKVFSGELIKAFMDGADDTQRSIAMFNEDILKQVNSELEPDVFQRSNDSCRVRSA